MAHVFPLSTFASGADVRNHRGLRESKLEG
jgi:hypothetical protein